MICMIKVSFLLYKKCESNYILDKPPQITGMGNPLIIAINIYTIDYIDTIRMEISITFKVRIRWKDPRLKYANIFESQKTTDIEQILGKDSGIRTLNFK